MICNNKYLPAKPPSHRLGIALSLESHLNLLCFYAGLSSLPPFVLSASRSLLGRCLMLLVQHSGRWPFALPCKENPPKNNLSLGICAIRLAFILPCLWYIMYTIPVANTHDPHLAAVPKTLKQEMQTYACSCCAYLLLFGMIPFSSN